MELSVCIDALYSEMTKKDAIDQVLTNGIESIEFWGWEESDILSLEEYQKKKAFHVSAFCTKFISLTDASLRESYLDGLKQSIEAAKRIKCKCLISQTGADLGIDRQEQKRSLIDGLKACAPYLEESGITLVIEPLNIRRNHPGYFLSKSEEAVEIIKEVGSPNVKILFDIYHQQITEGDLITRIKEYMPYIGHFHAAGNPGRHELYDSEIAYKKVVEAIVQEGYKGFFGLEYSPLDAPDKGITFAKEIMG